MRDATKPRGKMTAYAFFVQNCRQEHKRNYPDQQVVFSEFSKKCAAKWKELNGDQKTPFEDMAARDKLRWEEEMRHYTPPDGRKVKKTKRKKDPNAPKRPQTAFFLFCADHRQGLRDQFPDLRIGDIAKKLGHKWSECDEQSKLSYESKAAGQKEEYRRKMELYKSGQYSRESDGKMEVPAGQQAGQPQTSYQGQVQNYDDDDEDSEE